VPSEVLPARITDDVGKVADRCRALAEENAKTLFGGVTVSAPATVSAELVRTAVEDALDDRALAFVRVTVVPGDTDHVALRELTFRPSPLVDEEIRLRAALANLDHATWGVCDGCGRPILAQRLAVHPDTRLCSDCADPTP
jgi:hypothetical protein